MIHYLSTRLALNVLLVFPAFLFVVLADLLADTGIRLDILEIFRQKI